MIPLPAWLRAVVMCGLGALGGAACREEPRPLAGASMDTVRVGVSDNIGSAPVLLAVAGGDFARHGIVLDVVRVANYQDALTGLLSDRLDVALQIVHTATLGAMAKGGMVRVVASLHHLDPEGCAYSGIVVRRGIGKVDAAAAVRRLRVAPEGASRYLAERSLSAIGMTLQDFEPVAVPSEVVEQTMLAGRLDAAYVREPQLTRLAREGALWLRSDDVEPGFQLGVVLFGGQLLGPQRDVGERFIAGFRRGVRRYGEGKTPEAMALLGDAVGAEADVLAASCWPAIREDGRINLPSILRLQAWSLANGFLDRAATPAQIWDSSFVVASDRILANTME